MKPGEYVRPEALQKGMGVANGTFGELLQGSLKKDNDHFLVTLPIRKFSNVVFTPNASSNRITVIPGHKTKSRELVQKLIRHYELCIGGELTIQSELPEGKGMASSSADLVATARSFESAMGCTLPIELILMLLRTIEPSDGVMYSEFVTFFHRRVELRRRLGSLAGLKIVGIDEGGRTDTIEYNLRNDSFTDEECAEYAELLWTIEQAILNKNLDLLGCVTTRSAVLNQKRNPKRFLDRIIEISRDLQALGVVVTHSGPCLGLLFSDEPGNQPNIDRAKTALGKLADNVLVVESLGL